MRQRSKEGRLRGVGIDLWETGWYFLKLSWLSCGLEQQRSWTGFSRGADQGRGGVLTAAEPHGKSAPDAHALSSSWQRSWAGGLVQENKLVSAGTKGNVRSPSSLMLRRGGGTGSSHLGGPCGGKREAGGNTPTHLSVGSTYIYLFSFLLWTSQSEATDVFLSAGEQKVQDRGLWDSDYLGANTGPNICKLSIPPLKPPVFHL